MSCCRCLVGMLLLLSMGNEDRRVAASDCGKPVLVSRIVGGQIAQRGEWPWQVSLRKRGSHICGGSLISRQWVISAAHCFERPVNNSLFSVLLGASTLSIASSSDFTSPVKRIIVNSNYTYVPGSKGDIALLQLQTPLNFTDYILPVCLPTASVEFPAGMNCWVTGWGTIGSSGVALPYPRNLQEVQVPIIGSASCKSMYNSNSILNDMMCAGYKEGGKDSCQGDSGGPLVCQSNTTWILAGIVSWGDGCARVNRPGVYTRVSSYSNWIQQYAPNLDTYKLSNSSSSSVINATSTDAPNTALSSKRNSRILFGLILVVVFHCFMF